MNGNTSAQFVNANYLSTFSGLASKRLNAQETSIKPEYSFFDLPVKSNDTGPSVEKYKKIKKKIYGKKEERKKYKRENTKSH